MITILEGPDGAGKTYLQSQLLQFWGESVADVPKPLGLHQGPYDGNPLMETLEALGPVHLPDHHLICDRLHLGERVYGPLVRGNDTLGWPRQRMLERALLGMGGVSQVICYPPFERIEWDGELPPFGHGHDDDPEDVHKLIYMAYKTVPSMLPTVTYDWTRQDVGWLLQELQHVRSPVNPGPGIGWWEEGVILIVGERVNTNTDGPMLPFVGEGGSSLWLAEHLDDVDERWLYWVNAHTPDQREEDPAFIDELRPAHVIGLGAVASEWLTRHGHDHERLNHPQYHKRFLHGETYPLRDRIHELRGES